MQKVFADVRSQLMQKLMGSKPPKGLIFDLDGVLADPRKANARTVRALLDEYGFESRHPQFERICCGTGPKEILLALVPMLDGKPKLVAEMSGRMAEISKGNLHHLQPTPLVEEIPALAERAKLGIATNRDGNTRTILANFRIEHYFGVIATSLDAPSKPSPEMLMFILEKMGITPQDAVFIGDNESDMEASRLAGTPFIHVKWSWD